MKIYTGKTVEEVLATVCEEQGVTEDKLIYIVSDKKKALVHSWRVKESTLLIISALGGSLGMYITMKTIRHKTKKKKFMVGIPLIFILQALIIGAVLYLKNPW